jgi:hypothetical protein
MSELVVKEKGKFTDDGGGGAMMGQDLVLKGKQAWTDEGGAAGEKPSKYVLDRRAREAAKIQEDREKHQKAIEGKAAKRRQKEADETGGLAVRKNRAFVDGVYYEEDDEGSDGDDYESKYALKEPVQEATATKKVKHRVQFMRFMRGGTSAVKEKSEADKADKIRARKEKARKAEADKLAAKPTQIALKGKQTFTDGDDEGGAHRRASAAFMSELSHMALDRPTVPSSARPRVRSGNTPATAKR